MDSLFIRKRRWTLNFFRDDTYFEGVLVIIHPFHTEFHLYENKYRFNHRFRKLQDIEFAHKRIY